MIDTILVNAMWGFAIIGAVTTPYWIIRAVIAFRKFWAAGGYPYWFFKR